MDAHSIGEQEGEDPARYPHEGGDTDVYMMVTESEDELSTRTEGEDVLME